MKYKVLVFPKKTNYRGVFSNASPNYEEGDPWFKISLTSIRFQNANLLHCANALFNYLCGSFIRFVSNCLGFKYNYVIHHPTKWQRLNTIFSVNSCRCKRLPQLRISFSQLTFCIWTGGEMVIIARPLLDNERPRVRIRAGSTSYFQKNGLLLVMLLVIFTQFINQRTGFVKNTRFWRMDCNRLTLWGRYMNFYWFCYSIPGPIFYIVCSVIIRHLVISIL